MSKRHNRFPNGRKAVQRRRYIDANVLSCAGALECNVHIPPEEKNRTTPQLDNARSKLCRIRANITPNRSFEHANDVA